MRAPLSSPPIRIAVQRLATVSLAGHAPSWKLRLQRGSSMSPPAVRTKCLKDLGIGGLRLAHQQAGALIHAYREEWKWSDWDVAKAMKHIMPATKQDAPKRTPPPEADVYGNTLRDEIQDIIAAVDASRAALDAAPPAADQAVSKPDDGADASMLEGLSVVQNMGKGYHKRCSSTSIV